MVDAMSPLKLHKQRHSYKDKYSSLRRHMYLIQSNEDFVLERIDICSIIRQFLPFMPKADFKVNILDNRILIFTFKKPQRIRLNDFNRIDARISRIKLSDLFLNLKEFDWIDN